MKKTILIVDDSESIREIVGYMLTDSDYSVIKSQDGNEALEQLDGKEIDLIITDLNMPNLDGFGLIRKVRDMDKYKYIPILVLTTESQLSKKNEAREAGATGWIVKPFEKDKLLNVVYKVIR